MQTRSPKHVAHARRRHGDTELLQLALDALIAPEGVVPGQADDQADDLVGERRPATAPLLGPLSPHQVSVPAEQGIGGDKEGSPEPSGKQSAEQRQHRAVRGPEGRPLHLASQDGQLMTEYVDLNVLRILRADAPEGHAE